MVVLCMMKRRGENKQRWHEIQVSCRHDHADIVQKIQMILVLDRRQNCVIFMLSLDMNEF
jgi:hypothetical protein